MPVAADINGDGIDDLICGSLEYGASYPIDSEYFPYKLSLIHISTALGSPTSSASRP